jgi:hypothetical protein
MASESETAKRYNHVLNIIDERLVPDEGAKKARGEVFTPLDLVREMLFGLRKSALDEDKTEIWGLDKEGNFFDDKESDRVGGIPLEVWRDSNSTWLDPANGIGNFPVVAFYMLDYQLGNYQKKGTTPDLKGDKNKEKRRKHIVKNMLFMIEINKGNVNTSRKIFKKIVPDIEPNIICANTLKLTDDDIKKHFGINRFDVIMGNPPFNEGGTGISGKKNIFVNFVKFSLDILNKNGFLVFLHPPDYRINNHISKGQKIDLNDLMTKYQLKFIRMYSIQEVLKIFNIIKNLDYYLLQKKDVTEETEIVDYYNFLETIKINHKDYIPNLGFSIIKKLKQFIDKYGIITNIHNDSQLHHTRIKHGEYPIVHLINKDGLRIIKSKEKHDLQDIPKIMINYLGEAYVFFDKDGKYGGTEYQVMIPTKSKKLYNFLNSKIFHLLSQAVSITGNVNSRRVFEYIPNIELIKDLDTSTEDSINTFFKFNTNEKKLIDRFKVPQFKHVEKIEKAGEGKTRKSKAKAETGGAKKKHHKTRKHKKPFFGLF